MSIRFPILCAPKVWFLGKMETMDLFLYIFGAIFYFGEWQSLWVFPNLAGHSPRGPIVSFVVCHHYGGTEYDD